MAAGGTGGHLFAAQGLGSDLIRARPQTRILFLGSGLSKSPYFQKELFAHKEVSGATPYKKKPILLIKACFKLLKGVLQSVYHLKKKGAQVVIGFGSFHSFPPLLAARLMGIPLIIFDPNTLPGKVNRFFSRWAAFNAIYFKSAARHFKGDSVSVHMPSIEKKGKSCAKKARSHFGLSSELFTFLVFGGSQGAQAINSSFCAFLKQFASTKGFPFQVIHLVGSLAEVEKIRLFYASYQVLAVVKPFEKRMDLAWSSADLSISRAGAATLAEQIEFGVPSILIPYPYATEDHQEKNATFLEEEVGGGVKLLEKELSAGRLILIIESLLKERHYKLKLMKKALKEFKQSEDRCDFSVAVLNFLEGKKGGGLS